MQNGLKAVIRCVPLEKLCDLRSARAANRMFFGNDGNGSIKLPWRLSCQKLEQLRGQFCGRFFGDRMPTGQCDA